MFFVFTVHRDKIALPFMTPRNMCCNCGTPDGLTLVETLFKRTRFMLVAGTETTFGLWLPYCKRCHATAKRYAHGWFNRLLMAALMGSMFFLIATVVGIDPTMLHGVPLPNAAAALGLVVVEGFFMLRRIRPPQTCVTQPVWMHSVRLGAGGKLSSMTLAFSNIAYADAFTAGNLHHLGSGLLRIVRPQPGH
ncbi:hypothetical protein [Dyella sp.]|uniref:hypothetical protein n=1 Tax=Dyella sp. TaxID=1869338 RepID=UPI002ED4548F